MEISWEKLKKETAKRNRKIYRLVKSKNKKLKEVGDMFGITRQRVGKIVKDWEKRNAIDNI
jgi:DNA-directed RNA polymerase specialized sigma subunit